MILAAALYKEDYALPYAKIAQLFEQNCGLKISAGGLAQGLQRLSKRFQGELEALRAAIRASPFAHVDETGWRVDPDWSGLFVGLHRQNPHPIPHRQKPGKQNSQRGVGRRL